MKYHYIILPTCWRLLLNPVEGIQLNHVGKVHKRWIWQGMIQHYHAPPFQPITLSLNKAISVRVVSQENIIVTFSLGIHVCRLNVGSCLRPLSRNFPVLADQDREILYLRQESWRIAKLLQSFAEETKRFHFLLDKDKTNLKLQTLPGLLKNSMVDHRDAVLNARFVSKNRTPRYLQFKYSNEKSGDCKISTDETSEPSSVVLNWDFRLNKTF